MDGFALNHARLQKITDDISVIDGCRRTNILALNAAERARVRRGWLSLDEVWKA